MCGISFQTLVWKDSSGYVQKNGTEKQFHDGSKLIQFRLGLKYVKTKQNPPTSWFFFFSSFTWTS